MRALLDLANEGALLQIGASADVAAAAQARLEAEQREQAAKPAKLDHEGRKNAQSKPESLPKLPKSMRLCRSFERARQSGRKD